MLAREGPSDDANAPEASTHGHFPSPGPGWHVHVINLARLRTSVPYKKSDLTVQHPSGEVPATISLPCTYGASPGLPISSASDHHESTYLLYIDSLHRFRKLANPTQSEVPYLYLLRGTSHDAGSSPARYTYNLP